MTMWRYSPFRTLAVIFLIAFLVGICEYVSGTRHERDIYGDPQNNFPDAMVRLYPGSAEAEYWLGRKLESESIRKSVVGTGLQLTAEARSCLTEAARHYERAIALGLKSDENLYYNYALTLIRTRAEPEKIDLAIAAWRRSFPYSTRRPLEERRQSIERYLSQDSAKSSSDIASQEIQDILDYTPEWRAKTGYVGSESCRECHAKEFDSYLKTAHSQSLSEVVETSEPAGAVFDHLASGRRYRIEHRGDKLIHTETLLFKDGSELQLASKPLKYRVGSGRFARSYLTDEGGGFLFESPVTWYESTQAWNMTPGFDRPHHQSFSRPVLEDCLNCHAGHAVTSTTSHFRLHLVENAIGCERCHGPGEQHIAFHRDRSVTETDPIVNPQRLSRHLAEAICHQCHLRGDIQIGGRDHRAVDYRPGQLLELFSAAYRSKSSTNEMTVVGHVEQLKASACYRGSEKLSCVTCHDPHAASPTSDPIEHYRSICMTCHAEKGCKLDQATREARALNNCVKCHMPRSDTEVPHVAFTHHHIGVHPLKRDGESSADAEDLVAISDLSALSEADRNRSLMLAKAQKYLQANLDYRQSSAGQRLAQILKEWFDSMPAEEDAETEYARTQFLLASSNSTAATQSAERTLTLGGIRSEEAVGLIEHLARLDFSARRFEQAARRLRQLTHLRCSGQDWYLLGLAEERRGGRESAIQALERASQLEPASAEILEALIGIRNSSQRRGNQPAETLSKLKRSQSEKGNLP